MKDNGNAVLEVWADLDVTHVYRGIQLWQCRVEAAVRTAPVAAVLLHYSVFAYSYRGIPLPVVALALWLRRLRVPVVIFLHEFVYPWHRRGLRGSAHAATQRCALVPLIAASTGLIVTTPNRKAWLTSQRWLPRRTVTFVPVFSNISLADQSHSGSVAPRAIVFGYGSEGFDCETTVSGVAAATLVVPGLRLLLVGAPGPGSAAGAQWAEAAHTVACPIDFTGILRPDQISLCLKSALVAIFPDDAGPTSRKSTLAALLCHGCPVIAFEGQETWQELADSGAVYMIQPTVPALAASVQELFRNTALRQLMCDRARHFYKRRMAIEQAAGSVIAALLDATGTRPPRPGSRRTISKRDGAQ